MGGMMDGGGYDDGGGMFDGGGGEIRITTFWGVKKAFHNLYIGTNGRQQKSKSDTIFCHSISFAFPWCDFFVRTARSKKTAFSLVKSLQQPISYSSL